MSRPARQVRTVRLSAPDEQSIRRGALLLEDALHTASLPDAAGGRLLVVRSLACGPIQIGQSPASLALRIEQRMRQLSASAIYAEEPTAETATAVYFHDAVEPYIRLALRLARHEPTRAWFWRLAVPGWHAALPRDAALRLLLDGVAQTESGPAAVAQLLRALHEREVLPALLAALRWQDGPALLRASGWSRAGDSLAWSEGAADAPPEIGGAWRPLLAEWFAAWGVEDARSVWLAHAALVAERPARLLDARLPLRARRLIEQLMQPSLPAPAEPPAAAPDRAPPRPPHTPPDPSSAAQVALAAPDDEEPQRAASGSKQVVPDAPAAPAAEPAPASAHRDVAADRPAAEQPGWAGLPLPSAYAGLFFTMPALARLGMGALLERSPELIELSLPDLVLRTVALRLGSAADDAALLSLAARSPLGSAARLDWLAPPIWRETLTQPGPLVLRPIAGAGAGRALYDGSGRLLLALWHGRAPDELRPLLAAQQLRRGPTLAAQPDLDLLLAAWLVALRRWCRRYARLGLHDLVCRPGRIVATRTHLDILFDHQLADLRIRRAGLDIDPGWLPWFGRVVLFHYLYGEF